ncbi:unnamed protein product [Arctia plantaginis]|uniref:Uncharacterized protein n=1 Tax=Arctia plantaginis TaxID=874455 RepID=A0A8S1A3Z9_ARCPL|nr:unnamed protein product [Arctia plantaginis]
MRIVTIGTFAVPQHFLLSIQLCKAYGIVLLMVNTVAHARTSRTSFYMARERHALRIFWCVSKNRQWVGSPRRLSRGLGTCSRYTAQG